MFACLFTSKIMVVADTMQVLFIIAQKSKGYGATIRLVESTQSGMQDCLAVPSKNPKFRIFSDTVLEWCFFLPGQFIKEGEKTSSKRKAT